MFKSSQLLVLGSATLIAGSLGIVVAPTAVAWPTYRNSGAGISIQGRSTARSTPAGSFSTNNTTTRNVGTGNLSINSQSGQTSTPVGVEAVSNTQVSNGELGASLTTGAAAGQTATSGSGSGLASGSTSGGSGRVSTRAAGNASPQNGFGFGQGNVRVRK